MYSDFQSCIRHDKEEEAKIMHATEMNILCVEKKYGFSETWYGKMFLYTLIAIIIGLVDFIVMGDYGISTVVDPPLQDSRFLEWLEIDFHDAPNENIINNLNDESSNTADKGSIDDDYYNDYYEEDEDEEYEEEDEEDEDIEYDETGKYPDADNEAVDDNVIFKKFEILKSYAWCSEEVIRF